jgi:hypothetical protein
MAQVRLVLLLGLVFLVHSYLFNHPEYRIARGRQGLKRIHALKSSLTDEAPTSVIDRSLGGTIVVSGIGNVEEDEFLLSLLNQQVLHGWNGNNQQSHFKPQY